MSNFQIELASEDTVKDFILAAKSITGVNLTPRDESMLKRILTSEKVTNGGIEITFTESKVAVDSRDFSTQYGRRRRYG